MKSMIFTLLLTALSPAAWAVDVQTAEVGLLAQREHAEELRSEAKDIRRRAEEVYSLEDAECNRKILVNACRDSARERYLKEVSQARTKEIEANHIDTEAKKALNRLHESELKAKRIHQQSATREKSSRSAPKPAASGTAAAASEPARDAPPPLSAEKAAKFEAEKQRRRQEAEAQHAKEAAQAKVRAAKAKEDAARYDARAREMAERKAKRAGQSTPASSSMTH